MSRHNEYLPCTLSRLSEPIARRCGHLTEVSVQRTSSNLRETVDKNCLLSVGRSSAPTDAWFRQMEAGRSAATVDLFMGPGNLCD